GNAEKTSALGLLNQSMIMRLRSSRFSGFVEANASKPGALEAPKQLRAGCTSGPCWEFLSSCLIPYLCFALPEHKSGSYARHSFCRKLSIMPQRCKPQFLLCHGQPDGTELLLVCGQCCS